MTPAEFLHYRKALGLSRREMGEAIGRSGEAIKSYELGRLRITKTVELAVLAVWHRLEADGS